MAPFRLDILCTVLNIGLLTRQGLLRTGFLGANRARRGGSNNYISTPMVEVRYVL